MQPEKEFEQSTLRPYLSFVQPLKKIMVLVLVALWSLASHHCKLELLTSFNFLDCCATEIAASHPKSDCDTDGCEIVEGGIYKTEEGRLAVFSPPLVGIIGDLPVSKSSPTNPQTALAPISPPPELSVSWQFVSRAAAPPRSPSIVS